MTTTLADENPVARKEHHCSDCGRIIRAGETYRRFRGVGDDGVFTWKSCAHCDKVAAAIWAVEGAYYADEGIDIAEWLTEYRVEPLASQIRDHWRGVAADEVDVAPIRSGL
jgi:hypothetical protein